MKLLNLAGLNIDNTKIDFSVNKFTVEIDGVFSGSFYTYKEVSDFLDAHNITHCNHSKLALIQSLKE